jgi:hypothetical protein
MGPSLDPDKAAWIRDEGADVPLGRPVGTVRQLTSGITRHPGPHGASRLELNRATGTCYPAPMVALGGPREARRRTPWSLPEEAPEPRKHAHRHPAVSDLAPAT